MAANLLPIARDEFTGQVIGGKYELLCHLATGGMSELALAFQRGLAGFQKVVVIKRILSHISEDSEFVALFLDEARITARFTHPNIVQVFDLDKDGSSPFLAMEFVAGAALHEVLDACAATREPLPIGLTLAAVRDGALALHYAHTRGDTSGKSKQVIHRDVAPKNIMVTFDGTTKLLDFGIAKMAGLSARTAVGRIRGSVGYMSPEQMFGGVLGPATDIFSLGVVLFECLTERPLYPGEMLEDTIREVLGALPVASQLNPKIPVALDAVLLRALAPKPEDRYPTALEFAHAIERVGRNLIWTPDKCGAFIRTLFSSRYEQTCALLNTETAADADVGGRFRRLTGSFNQVAPPAAQAPRAAFQDERKEEQRTEMVPAIKARAPAPAFEGPEAHTTLERSPEAVAKSRLGKPGSQSRPVASKPPSGSSPTAAKPSSQNNPVAPRQSSQNNPIAPKRQSQNNLAAPRALSHSQLPVVRAPVQPLQSAAPAPAPSLFFDPVANPFEQSRPSDVTDPLHVFKDEDLRPLLGGSSPGTSAPAPRFSLSDGAGDQTLPIDGARRRTALPLGGSDDAARDTLPPAAEPDLKQPEPAPAPRVIPPLVATGESPVPAPRWNWLVWGLAFALVLTISLWALDRYRSSTPGRALPWTVVDREAPAPK